MFKVRRTFETELLEANIRNLLPGMCETLQLSGYDRFALIVEGWVVMGEENLKDIERWVGRVREHPKAQTSIQIIFVSPEVTFGKFAVYDETEAGWVIVKEVELAPDWSLAGVLIEAMKAGLDGEDKGKKRFAQTGLMEVEHKRTKRR